MARIIGILALSASLISAIVKMFGPLPWSTYDWLSIVWGVGAVVAVIAGFACQRFRAVSWTYILGGGLLFVAGVLLPTY